MPSLLSRDLAVAPADKAYVYICDVADTEGLGLTLSDSGKAVLLPRPRGIGDFWAPLKLCRKLPGGKCFHDRLVLPMWFLKTNHISF
jgi:hypothetical protein